MLFSDGVQYLVLSPAQVSSSDSIRNPWKSTFITQMLVLSDAAGIRNKTTAAFYRVLLLYRKLSNFMTCSPLNCFSFLRLFVVPFVIPLVNTFIFPCVLKHMHLTSFPPLDIVFNFLSGHFILNLIQIKAGLLCEAQKFNLPQICAGFSSFCMKTTA